LSPTRRDFLGAGAAAAAGLAFPTLAGAGTGAAEAVSTGQGRAASRPIVIGSANGNLSRNSAGKTGVQVAYEMMAGGGDPLDAAIAGVTIVELDPEDQSVGLGGLPNEEGVVQLDASCMHGPTKRAGSVACLEDIATAAQVAKAVMDHTDHVMLVGPDAKRFAVDLGFKTQNLLTDESREDWLRWKSRLNANDVWLDRDTTRTRRPRPAPPEEAAAGHVWRDDRGTPFTYGTINLCAVNARGDIGSVTTTSGRSWKIPGRVGDSPIIGAGQYCDNGVGAAGSTGRGEACIKVCASFLAVELMRQGKSPEQALLEVMQRVVAMTESRLIDRNGRPLFDLEFYAVSKDGRYAGASAYEGSRFAIADERGARFEPTIFLYKKSERSFR
jgi:N4-(beta-N-acetylglucosaminyl)-L-asparaginase